MPAFATKLDAMNALERARADWLLVARAHARLAGQGGRAITVNDLHGIVPPLPSNLDPRVWGAVFNSSEWECLGYVRSRRKLSHRRPVAQFVLRGSRDC